VKAYHSEGVSVARTAVRRGGLTRGCKNTTETDSKMPTFRGNVGNLLQHWVLCEVLAACEGSYERLGFIDGYSMAPLATDRSKRDPSSDLFDAVAGGLPGQHSSYERAWLKLAASPHEYPNSAAFVTAAWRNRYALFLCESDPATVLYLNRWARIARQFPGCEGVKVAAGDWRSYLCGHLLPSSDLVFFSFDPYMFDRHGSGRNPGNMDPEDLNRLARVFDTVDSPVLVQLSTYSANNNNPQEAVAEVITSTLHRVGLVGVARVRVDGNMMSLVLARNVNAPALQQLASRFSAWLASVRGNGAA